MNANFLELYEGLVRDINAILKTSSSDKEKMESCFRSGIDHWNKLKEKIKREGFASEEEEIHFFKNVKPRFTGEIEYYTQRYHAILFLPETDKQSQINFWEGELGRLDKFFGSYHEFFQYYHSKKKIRIMSIFSGLTVTEVISLVPMFLILTARHPLRMT